MTTGTAFYMLIMLYVVGSVLVAYIAVRAYRRVQQRRDQSVALPRPVYEMASRKSLFSFVRTNGRSLNGWKLPVPWTRSPADSSFRSKAASTASVKGLSIELLPTTALPPPPPLIPTSLPLVDLGTPSALEASRFSASLPSSPRRQAVSLWQQQPSSPPHSLRGHRKIQHPAFPRPPSPHALLVTTPPQSQKRSRSLGGVPVRRLSGGQSGLRNKLDVELQDLVPGHARRTSEEHLLIDFSSSSDDQVSGPETMSPAASDIGDLSPPAVDSRNVGPQPMHLVDIIGDDAQVVSTDLKSEPDDTAWMWFKSNAPSTIRSYDARVLAPRPQAAPFLGGQKSAFPLPFPKTEQLVDIASSGACLELASLDSSRTLVEVGSDPFRGEDQSSPIQETSEDVGVSMDPFSDDYAIDYIPTALQTQVDVHGNGDQVQHDEVPHYLDCTESQVQNDLDPTSAYPLVDVDNPHMETPAEAGLVFGDSQILSGTDQISPTLSSVPVVDVPRLGSSPSPSSQLDQPDWRWVEADDPWADHVTVQDETFTLDTYGGAVHSHLGPVTQDHQGENGFMEKSPGGSLLATALDADEEVPQLNLDDFGPAEELQLSHVRGQLDDEAEEDATPRPTPVSVDIQLPVSDHVASLLPGIDNTDHMARSDSPRKTRPIGRNVEQAIINENFPDPYLLPLPEFNSPSSIVKVMRTSANESEDEPLKFEPRSSPQMLTPPASPPLPSPALPKQRKAGRSLPPAMTGPKNLAIAGDVTRGRSTLSSPLPLQIALPADAPKEKDGDLMQEVSVPSPTPLTADSTECISSGQAVKDAEEVLEADEIEEKETSLPGSLLEISSTSPLTTSIASSKTSQTVAARLAEKSGPVPFYPSVRAIVRQPVEIALAMQLRPGLGAGADPAWMVRFLMAMFGWFAVLVSGQENY